MDSDNEEPPSKRRRYERSSTPIRELGNLVPPDLPPVGEEDAGENGLESGEEPVALAPVAVAESDTEQEEDTVCPDDNEEDPDYGLSDEAMGKQSKMIILMSLLPFMIKQCLGHYFNIIQIPVLIMKKHKFKCAHVFRFLTASNKLLSHSF